MSEVKSGKNGLALKNAVEKVVTLANARGIQVTADDLIKLVKTHAAGATASTMAMAALPGAGSTIATGVEIGFVWSMYYRICTKLGINVKKNVIKSVGSALITNLAGGLAAQLITGTVLSIVPGLGTLGAVALIGLTSYSVTYYSGIVFMNLLVRLFKAGQSLETMSENELKSMMKEEAQNTSFKDVQAEAKQAYKTRKEDGVAQVIADDDASTAPMRPERTYWLHTGVDFGSTNSVMAWRLYHWTEENGWQPDSEYNKDNNIVRCPTVLVYKSDNPDHPDVQAEEEDVIVGKRAEALATDNLEPAVARTNFKPLFYDAAEGSPEQREAIRHTSLFMNHLYQLYKAEILDLLPNSVLTDMCATVHLTTPVRAERVHRDLMKALAEKAGFVHDGKTYFVDTSRNEAESVMHLCVDSNLSTMQRLVNMSSGKAALNLLFIDVGGSTTDIELIKQEMHASHSTQVLAMWPRGNVQYMLGGREVDRAIFDYLIDTGCLVPEFANACWDHGTGKTLFRRLKENYNERLRAGQAIEKLSNITTACGDPDEEIRPRSRYRDHIITKEVFEEKICRRYINDLTDALHEVLKGQVGEDEVDAVFVTGAGSRLYFIHDLILGRHGDRPLALTQIQQDESRLFDRYRDPATCCAEGAISAVM